MMTNGQIRAMAEGLQTGKPILFFAQSGVNANQVNAVKEAIGKMARDLAGVELRIDDIERTDEGLTMHFTRIDETGEPQEKESDDE